VAVETNSKYNLMREQQLAHPRKGKVTLLPGERQPLLPPIEELSRYADPTAGAAAPAQGTDETEMRPPVQTTPLEEPAQPEPSRPPNQAPPPTSSEPRPKGD
jgi:hypothetical protein